MTDQPAPVSKDLVVRKFIVTIPGQSITWYEDESESVNFGTRTAFPRKAHGYVYTTRIPRTCTSEELADYLNGSIPVFSEDMVAKLEDGFWVPVGRQESPTADEVLAAFINGEYKND